MSPDAVDAVEARFADDERAQLRGEPAATQPVVGGAGASYSGSDAISFYLQPLPAGVWENRVTVRSAWWARMYAPDAFIARVSPTPLLMVVADHDHLAATDRALAASARALEPTRLVLISGGHFDPYAGGFETASSAAVDWFTRHL